MNQKLTSIDTRPEPKSEPKPDPKPEPKTPPTPTTPKRTIRRQVDLGLVTGPGPGFLLSYEDAAALQSLRQSIQDHVGARTTAELVAAEFATADGWIGLRAQRLYGATVDTEVQANAEAVDREFEEIDDTCRTALIYHDTAIARLLRQFERSAAECRRAYRQVFPIRAAKTRR